MANYWDEISEGGNDNWLNKYHEIAFLSSPANCYCPPNKLQTDASTYVLKYPIPSPAARSSVRHKNCHLTISQEPSVVS